jgi:peptidyl-tRNA hydrolase ICT1
MIRLLPPRLTAAPCRPLLIAVTRPSPAVLSTAYTSRTFASGRDGEVDEEELKAARQWLSKLDPETIPRDLCEVSFSRSSGPGGQNVNK